MLTFKEILKATKGDLIQGQPLKNINGFSIDTRSLKKGNFFIAIKGRNLDGHAFLQKAIARGASGVIVSKKVKLSKKATVVYVKDTTKALGQIAKLYREQFSIPIIAVTGSAGKTTTKNMIASVLGQRYKVLKNAKSENNQFGVPLTLFKLQSSHDIAVLELGTNQFGDMAWLAAMAKPDVVVFTNIGASHLEGLKTPAGVFREKFQLVKHTAPDGVVIFNQDDPHLAKVWQKKIPQKKISYGIQSKATYQAKLFKEKNDYKVTFYVKRKKFTLKTPFAHNIYNALASICCGYLYKISYNNISTILSRFRFQYGRQEIKKIGRYWLIDDTYNSNPVSLKSSIETLDTLKTRGRKILVCADMLELGAKAKVLHLQMGKLIARSHIDLVVTFGKQAKFIHKGLGTYRERGNVFHGDSLQEINTYLKNYCRPHDIIFIKGSRAMHMEKIVTFLEKHLN